MVGKVLVESEGDASPCGGVAVGNVVAIPAYGEPVAGRVGAGWYSVRVVDGHRGWIDTQSDAGCFRICFGNVPRYRVVGLVTSRMGAVKGRTLGGIGPVIHVVQDVGVGFGEGKGGEVCKER